MRRVLVTGATGFVGRHICQALIAAGYVITAATRSPSATGIHPDVKIVNVGNIGPDTDWRQALDGVEIVIHAAGRTHVLREPKDISEESYKRTNFEATRALGNQAVKGGAERFIFISSVKAGGEFSIPGQPLRAESFPAPEDPYGRTKLAAEAALFELARESQMKVLALRAPLIYGPGIKGNLLSLFKVVDRGIILPLKHTNNKRDLIYVRNLIAAIMKTIDLQNISHKVYYVCDGKSVSTSDLVKQISAALGRPARLICLPIPILRILGWIFGQSSRVRRLTETLEIDGTQFCKDAEWIPPFTMKEGLASTASWFKSQTRD